MVESSAVKSNSKYKVVVGKEIDLEISVDDENGDAARLIGKIVDIYIKEVAGRHLLTGAIVTVLITALITAAVWGWKQADFSGLKQVWATGSLPLGWVAGHYFRKDGDRK